MRRSTTVGWAALALGSLTAAACDDRAPLPQELPAVAARPQDGAFQPYALRRTRAGFLRVATEQVHDNPAATPVLLRRLDDERDSERRAALVEALPRTGGEWVEEVLSRLPDESDPVVRKAMVATMARATPTEAAQGIAVGLADADAEVRLEAAVVAGALPLTELRAAGLVQALVRALGDEYGPVRAASARSLGIVRATEATASLARLQDDSEEPVRRQTIRALTRLAVPVETP